jgi:RNA polymerase sigma-70 factor (ECF subfamily)
MLPGEVANLEFGDFRRAFRQLADEGREALILAGGTGLSAVEAAQVCQSSARIIKSRLIRARRELLHSLEDAVLADRDTLPLMVSIGRIAPRRG